jgi:N-acyl-D-amino-acid deacylase
MKRHSGPLRATIAATACAALLVVSAAGQAPSDSTTLIRHALVIDGSGGSGRRVDVRIRGDRIVDVGALAPASGDRVVEAQGLALSPGFIDTHSHHDRGLNAAPDALAMVSQGVTTIVVGQDGGGLDLAQMFNRLDHQPVSVNVASYVGHGAIRSRVMGQDFKRWATADEVERMKVFVEAEMAAGALGLSTGLEYRPLLTNNVIFTGGFATLLPGQGFKQLYNRLGRDVNPLIAGFLEMVLQF